MLSGSNTIFIGLLCLFPLVIRGQASCIGLQQLINADLPLAIETADQNQALPCPNVLGEIYLRAGRNSLAEDYFRQGLEQATDENERAASLSKLAIVLWNIGNYHQAAELIEQALSIRKNSSDSALLAAAYNDYGLIYSSINAGKALTSYEQAEKIYKRLYETNNEKVAQSLINTGVAYGNLEYYGEAVINLNSASDIIKNLYPNQPHSTQAFIQFSLGNFHSAMGQSEAALQYFQKALDIYLAVHSNVHPDVARTYNEIGKLYNQKGEFEKALSFYQKALISNTLNFEDPDIESNPNFNDYLDANTLLNSLFLKAKAFEYYHFNFSLDFKDLKNSLNTLFVCDSLVDKIRQLRSNEADKLALSTLAEQVYETGVILTYTMADLSFKKDEYYEHAFYFSEKRKSAVLLEAIADASARQYANIPSEKLAEEQQLKDELTFYEQEVAKKETEENRRKLFDLTQRYHQFIASLEEEYPQYYNLKYNIAIPTVADLQKKLNENEALISYFLDNNRKRIFVFQITSKKLKVDNVPQGDNFNRHLSGFRNSIYFKDKMVYQKTAESLYKLLFPYKLPKGIDNITIIPTGKLGTLPFEALLTDNTKSKDFDFQSLPYLVKDYSITYAYAATLFYQQLTSSKNPSNTALLCAPIEFTGYQNLPGTALEIEDLKSIFSETNITTEVLLKEDANEANLKRKDLSKYTYLHMATHGQVNIEHPELSRIMLQSSADEDGSLFASEIYNLSLEANLVTLSACETGLGKVAEGEGIIGLSRALIYAGAHNLMVSLWQVADNSTAQLMTDFYKNLATYNDYSKPLQAAKSDMISSEFAEPFYWAPFILIGQ